MSFHQQPITFVGQVNLKIQNLERSLAFYEQVLGFKVLERTDRSAKLSADGRTVLITLQQPSHIVPKLGKMTGLYHFALLLPKRSDLASIVRHFIAIGLRFGSSDHLVSEALYLSDPDGNGIEIYTDREPSTWNWHNDEVAMTVDPLDFTDLLSSDGQESWAGMPDGVVIGHIHLHVSELKKTEQFYTEGLGFDVVNRYGAQALFISDGKYHHHIGLNTWNGIGAPAPSANSVGLESFTLQLDNVEKKDKIIEQLNSIGVAVVQENGTFMTQDPSGNRIILQATENTENR